MSMQNTEGLDEDEIEFSIGKMKLCGNRSKCEGLEK